MKTSNYFLLPTVALAISFLLISSGCTKVEEVIELPVVSTSEVTGVTNNSAICGGVVSSDGGSPIIERGVCWSTGVTQTIYDNKTSNGSSVGVFSGDITGLSQNTAYYVRAYATNAAGTGYGSAMWFKTDVSYEELTDIDGNVYKTVTIGTQTWMAENLKVTRYNDGTPIPQEISSEKWSKVSTGAWCDPSYSETYGKLYNWYAVGTSKLAPKGWHVPNDSEWTVLMDYLGGKAGAGGKLKEAGTTHWFSPNAGATNESGFTALPNAVRSRDGDFWPLGLESTWWSTSHTGNDHYGGYYWSLSYDHDSYVTSNASPKFGFAVRCIKD